MESELVKLGSQFGAVGVCIGSMAGLLWYLVRKVISIVENNTVAITKLIVVVEKCKGPAKE